ncbi:MAG TPA: hypothetical protein VHF69_04610, partial [Candidatus Synoicihabitans sp.]|nr:hypothetical protein [Candidatus Synoicihabitans sp.]
LDQAGAEGCWLVMQWKGLKASDPGPTGKLDAVGGWAAELGETERQALTPLLLVARELKVHGAGAAAFAELADVLEIDVTAIAKAANKSETKKRAKKVAAPPAPVLEAPKTLDQMRRAYEGGMSPAKIAREFATAIADVCGALEIDEKAEEARMAAIDRELEERLDAAGLRGQEVRDRLAKFACGKTYDEATLPEEMEAILRVLNQRGPNVPVEPSPASSADE